MQILFPELAIGKSERLILYEEDASGKFYIQIPFSDYQQEF